MGIEKRFMLNNYQNFLIYSGEHYSVYFHAEIENTSIVFEYFEACDDVTQASLLFLVKRMADIGNIYDETNSGLKTGRIRYIVLNQGKKDFFASSIPARE